MTTNMQTLFFFHIMFIINYFSSFIICLHTVTPVPSLKTNLHFIIHLWSIIVTAVMSSSSSDTAQEVDPSIQQVDPLQRKPKNLVTSWGNMKVGM